MYLGNHPKMAALTLLNDQILQTDTNIYIYIYILYHMDILSYILDGKLQKEREREIDRSLDGMLAFKGYPLVILHSY